MGSAFGSIRIQLNADTTKFKKGISESAGILSGFRKQVGALNGLIAGFVGFKAIEAIGGAMFGAAKASSDLTESVNAARATFGPFAENVIGSADDMAKKFGTVRSEFLTAAGSLGSIFKATGLGADEAARMSVSFVKLATDLSSLKNLTFEEALGKIRSGLVGEVEPLREVGVLLDDDAMKREAAAQGIAKQVKEMSAAEKLMLRAAIITRSLADANGNLAATSGDFANALRAAQGRLTNLAADVGGAFSDVSNFLTVGVGNAIAKLTENVGDQRKAWKEWASAAVREGGVVNQAIGGIGVGISEVIKLFRLWVRAIAAVAMGFVGLGMGLEKLGIITTIDKNASIEDFAKAFAKSANDLDKNLEGAADSARKFFEDIQKGAAKAGAAAEDLAGKSKRIEWKLKDPAAEMQAAAMGVGAAAMQGAAGAAGAAAALAAGGGLVAKGIAEIPKGERADLFAGAAVKGSAEARSAVLEARGRANPQKKIEQNTGDTVRELQAANASLATIASGIGGAAGETVF